MAGSDEQGESMNPIHGPGDEDSESPGGVVDFVSVLYVVGGIPAMILFFVVLFGLVGSCDGSNLMVHA